MLVTHGGGPPTPGRPPTQTDPETVMVRDGPAAATAVGELVVRTSVAVALVEVNLQLGVRVRVMVAEVVVWLVVMRVSMVDVWMMVVAGRREVMVCVATEVLHVRVRVEGARVREEVLVEVVVIAEGAGVRG
jgi:hypothetical protein